MKSEPFVWQLADSYGKLLMSHELLGGHNPSFEKHWVGL